ncbi:DUF362 domain-containing protein [Desulfosediminicola sp.]|uniref:DUF362 domain-containing protein n=1 Tax=Desulfosediminicola sp. TaxID=2886825 RepID=UPI003AF2EF22
MLLQKKKAWEMSRREFLKAVAGGVALSAVTYPLWRKFGRYFLEEKEAVFTAAVSSYSKNLREIIISGFQELGVTKAEIKGKRVLLKPNLVEPQLGSEHINTHPLMVRAAIEAFLSYGAIEVVVGEGTAHNHDTLNCLEATGLGDVLLEDSIRFIDFNNCSIQKRQNLGNKSKLGDLYLPLEVSRADIVVSLAKMKTHHWAGVTLSMKNMFGVMPGSFYGWPKNVLHQVGIVSSILDINSTVCPDFAIIDGIVGMEGDGPIMGSPVTSGVLVMGRNPAAVDATGARLMGVDPTKIPYLRQASGWLGTIGEKNIEQRGENWQTVRTNYRLVDKIPAQQGLRLK